MKEKEGCNGMEGREGSGQGGRVYDSVCRMRLTPSLLPLLSYELVG